MTADASRPPAAAADCDFGGGEETNRTHQTVTNPTIPDLPNDMTATTEGLPPGERNTQMHRLACDFTWSDVEQCVEIARRFVEREYEAALKRWNHLADRHRAHAAGAPQ